MRTDKRCARVATAVDPERPNAMASDLAVIVP